MSVVRLLSITAVTIIAFASNSLLCRLALTTSHIDPASFTTIRLLSGAIILAVLVACKDRSALQGGNMFSAVMLFTYAVGFSFAYTSLPAGTGALLLFGAVQSTMIGYGLFTGERLNLKQVAGIAFAVIGIIWLLVPGMQAPSPGGAVFMLGAGVAWGIYSLRGGKSANPTLETAGNFLRSIPLVIIVSAIMFRQLQLDGPGVVYATLSGAVASGLGYAMWYAVLPHLQATTAATVQLSVPAIAAIGGVVFLGEQITLRLAISSAAILGGIGLFIVCRRPPEIDEQD